MTQFIRSSILSSTTTRVLGFFFVWANLPTILSSSNHLQQARQLTAPPPQQVDQAEFEGDDFWEQHADLLRHAWQEYEEEQQEQTHNNNSSSSWPRLDKPSVLIHPDLRRAVEAAWAVAAETTSTTTTCRPDDDDDDNDLRLQRAERTIRHLLRPVAPGVWTVPLLDPRRIIDIRRHLEAANQSGIPTRRPNGMNRYGLILDDGTAGSVPLRGLQTLVDCMVNDYVRPLGRLLFPEYIGRNDKHQQHGGNGNGVSDNDSQSFAFTIRYREGEDVRLREHSDASLITLNVNLNLPCGVEDGETEGNENNDDCRGYTGSTLYFVQDTDNDDDTEHPPPPPRHYNVTFAPGLAVLHRGLTRHGARPIEQGERTNLIVWLFGPDGYVRVAPYDEPQRLKPRERWSVVSDQQQQQQQDDKDDDEHFFEL